MQRIIKKANNIFTVLLVLTVLLSCLSLSASAAEKDKVQLIVSVSDKNPQIGDTVMLTVEIENYATMTPQIAAMYVAVSFDPVYFTLDESSVDTSKLKINDGDGVAASFDGADKIEYYYAFANESGALLPKRNLTSFVLFTATLRVKSNGASEATTTFNVEACDIYNNNEKYSKISCQTPKIDTVTVWERRPAVILNDSGSNKKTYNRMVKIEFASGTATLKYNERDAVTISSPYYCKESGTYTVTVTKDGTSVTESFAVNRTIVKISIQAGTFAQEYALNQDLNTSRGTIIVEYSDESPYTGENGLSFIPMTDTDVQISGYDKTTAGVQTVTFEYMGARTTQTVTVKNVQVVSAELISSITQTVYPVGYDIDPEGGKLRVTYTDGTTGERDVEATMFSAYDKNFIGAQTIGLKVSDDFTLETAITVEYVSAQELNAFIASVSDINMSYLTAADSDKVSALEAVRDSLTAQFGPKIIPQSVIEKLANVRAEIVALTSGTNNPSTGEPSTESTASTGAVTVIDRPADVMKIVIYVVAIIVALSVLAGAVYFIIIYLKKRREDESEFYYSDDEDDEDDDITTVGGFDYDDQDFLSVDEEEENVKKKK